MVAIGLEKASSQNIIAPIGKLVSLKGSLPGEQARKGEPVSIAVTADDGMHRKQVELTKKIGEGGEGSVFETNVGADSDYVVKIYARNKLLDTKIDKLKLMMSKSIIHPGVCFPVALIENERNETTGFLMQRARGVELGKSVFMPKLLQSKFPSWTRRDTIQLCITILEKIKYLNDRSIILGDINGQNILVVSPTEVYFVDCDSYQIGNYPCPAGTAHFTPPEAQGKNYSTFLRTQAMENFAIATLLFMIMLPGKSPYAAVGGASPEENIRNGVFAYESSDASKIPSGKWGYIWSHMSFNVRQAFVETFRKNGAHFAPEKRLNTGQWLQLFKAYQHGITGMLAWDPMAMDLFPSRPKMRKCKKCGKKYVPDPSHYKPICPECAKSERAARQAARQAEENRKRAEHLKWLGEIWQQYPCKNPKCYNTITLYNRDREKYKFKRKPEYCYECWQDTPCRKCGYIAARWMHDERDGLCRNCYEKERREKKAAQQKPQQPVMKTTSFGKTIRAAYAKNRNSRPRKRIDEWLIYLAIFAFFTIVFKSCSS